MSSANRAFPAVPPDTAHAAKSVPDRELPYRALGQSMDLLAARCAAAAPDDWTSARLFDFMRHAVVTLLQMAERLTDRQAAEASHARVEWKYVLRWSLSHPGLQPSELCLFRQQLVNDPASWQMFVLVTAIEDAMGLWPQPDLQAAHLEATLVQLCHRNLSFWAAEAMAHALESLATHHPDWLRRVAPAHWYTRYAVYGPLSGAPPQEPPPPDALHDDVSYLFQMFAHAPGRGLAELPEVCRLRLVTEYVDKRVQDRRALRAICADCAVGRCISHGCFGLDIVRLE